jgi:hypothetical protein
MRVLLPGRRPSGGATTARTRCEWAPLGTGRRPAGTGTTVESTTSRTAAECPRTGSTTAYTAGSRELRLRARGAAHEAAVHLKVAVDRTVRPCGAARAGSAVRRSTTVAAVPARGLHGHGNSATRALERAKGSSHDSDLASDPTLWRVRVSGCVGVRVEAPNSWSPSPTVSGVGRVVVNRPGCARPGPPAGGPDPRWSS